MTDAARSYRSRARVVHRAPPPRAPRASQNPAERFAAKKRRATLANPTWCARKPAGCYWWSRWPFDSTSKGRVSIPRLERSLAQPDANRVRVFRLARHRGYAPRGRALPRPQVRTRRRPPRVLDSPRLSHSPVRLGSTHAARARIASYSRRSIRESRSITRLPGCRIRRTARADALTDIDAVDEFSLTPACPSQPCPEKINCSWVRHARKRRGAVRGGPL